MTNMKRTASGIALALCAFATVAADGAAPKRGGNGKKGETDQREEWIREVKKLEAEPVADGFVKWTGLDSVRGTGYLRCVTPSDLRGRFAIIVDIDETKAVEQIRATHQVRGLEFIPRLGLDWNFEAINRDVLVIYNLHGLSEADLAEKVLKDPILQQITGFSYFSNVTFDGAPNSESERPYIYVMGPDGKEPLYKGKLDKAKTAKEIRDAIEKAKAALPAWRPWYGYVEKAKYSKGFEAAIHGGKPLEQIIMSLKKGISSKKQDVAMESQRLYDAIGRTKGDLLYRIIYERLDAPFAAMYDIEEATRRLPSMRGKLASYSEKIEKAHPNAKSAYKHYALYRKYADPAFHPKSKGEAKKMVAELSKSKQAVAKFADDDDVAIQTLAMTLPGFIDSLIEELPTRVLQK